MIAKKWELSLFRHKHRTMRHLIYMLSFLPLLAHFTEKGIGSKRLKHFSRSHSLQFQMQDLNPLFLIEITLLASGFAEVQDLYVL